MINIGFFEHIELKRKFAKLMSYLFYCGHLSLENINDKLIHDDYLDLFERNDADSFVETSLEEIAKRLFPKISLDEYIDDVGAIYWSGIQYMNIFLNTRIPLRVLFIVCPLMDMVNKYDVYHEMSEIRLVEDFLSNEYRNNSILRYFRKKLKLSVASLTYLTKIPNSTLRYYELNNSNLYKIPAENEEILERILDIPSSILRKKSRYIPLTVETLLDENFKYILSVIIRNYFGKEIGENYEFTFSQDDIKDDKNYILLLDPVSIFVKGNEKVVDTKIFENLLSIAIDNYIQKYMKDTLVF